MLGIITSKMPVSVTQRVTEARLNMFFASKVRLVKSHDVTLILNKK